MQLRQYLSLVRKWLWLVLLCGAVAAVPAYYLSSRAPKIYRATTTLLISLADAQPNNTTANDLLYGERLARTYSQRLASRPVLEETARRLGLGERANSLETEAISVESLRDTQLIRLSVEHRNPELAQAIANTLPEVFSERNNTQQSTRYSASKESLESQIDDLDVELEAIQVELAELREAEPRDAAAISRLEDRAASLRNTQSNLLQSYEQVRLAEATTQNSLIVDEPAVVPTSPVRPRPLQNTAIALIIGIMMGAGAALLIEYLDDRINSPARVERSLKLPVLGLIGQNTSAASLVTIEEPKSPISEAYRVLRTNLQFAAVGRNLHLALISSASPQEGKSTITSNLAAIIAQAGQKVVVVDADLRRPRQHKIFSLPNNKGLTTAIVDQQVKVERLLHKTPTPNLHLLVSGPIPPNPAELLGSQRMLDIVDELTQAGYLVILDGPPILAVADASILAARADVTLLVIDASKTSQHDASRAADQLRQANANLVGVALNRMPASDGGYYYYYYSSDENRDDDGSTPHGKSRRGGRQQTQNESGGLLGVMRRLRPSKP